MNMPGSANRTSEDALYDEYKIWCLDHGYKWISADELLAELSAQTPPAPAADLKYLSDFIDRWDAAVKIVDRARAE